MQRVGILLKRTRALPQGAAFSPFPKHLACEWSLAHAGFLHWSLTPMFAWSVVWPEIAGRKPYFVKILRQSKLGQCMSVNHHKPQVGNDWVWGSFSSLSLLRASSSIYLRSHKSQGTIKPQFKLLLALPVGMFCFTRNFKWHVFTGHKFHVHLIPA